MLLIVHVAPHFLRLAPSQSPTYQQPPVVVSRTRGSVPCRTAPVPDSRLSSRARPEYAVKRVALGTARRRRVPRVDLSAERVRRAGRAYHMQVPIDVRVPAHVEHQVDEKHELPSTDGYKARMDGGVAAARNANEGAELATVSYHKTSQRMSTGGCIRLETTWVRTHLGYKARNLWGHIDGIEHTEPVYRLQPPLGTGSARSESRSRCPRCLSLPPL